MPGYFQATEYVVFPGAWRRTDDTCRSSQVGLRGLVLDGMELSNLSNRARVGPWR